MQGNKMVLISAGLLLMVALALSHASSLGPADGEHYVQFLFYAFLQSERLVH